MFLSKDQLSFTVGIYFNRVATPATMDLPLVVISSRNREAGWYSRGQPKAANFLNQLMQLPR